jgi:hypothetical protein
MTVILRAAVLNDAWRVRPYIQEADRRELEATGQPIETVLAYEIAASVAPVLAEADGEPVALWGLALPACLEETAHPWLVTCRAIVRHRVRMVREGLAQLAAWRAEGLALAGIVDDRYGAASAWMARAGFEVGPANVRVGPDRLAFRRFRRAA